MQEDRTLKLLTTLGVSGAARYLVEVSDREQIPEAMAFAARTNCEICVLGGGSNLVIHDDGFDGLVLHMANAGWSVLTDDGDSFVVRVGAGESWDRFVAHCVAQGWWGIENMSLIPGTVGAVPIQNVGAYGQEASDVLVRVDAWDVQMRQWVSLSAAECGFGYRSSIFARRESGRYVISDVYFNLSRKGQPNLTHAAVAQHLSGSSVPSLKDMREAVIALRTDGRLPDPNRIGNAGSFFKNVTLTTEEHALLLDRISFRYGEDAKTRLARAGYALPDQSGVKVPAAQLIDLCGLRGCSVGGAALYERNPMIVVNQSGEATADDVRRLAQQVIRCVYEWTGIRLEPEPRFIGFGALAWDLA